MGHVMTFVGDVQEVKAVPVTGGYHLWLSDHTSSDQLRVSCPQGPLAEFAEKAKKGQVILATGWAQNYNRFQSHMSVPIVVRAQNGTNEAELNDLSTQYIRQLAGALSGEDLRKARAELAIARASSERLKVANAEQYERIRVLEKDLEYEKLLNGAVAE